MIGEGNGFGWGTKDVIGFSTGGQRLCDFPLIEIKINGLGD